MSVARKRGQGEGSIFYLEKRGRWCAEVDFGHLNGKRRRSRRSFTTRREAARYLAEATRTAQSGLPPVDGHTTLADFLDRWMEEVVRASTRAPATVASYENAVRVHIKPVLGHHRLRDLRHEHVLGLVNGMRASGSGRSLMNTVLVVLRLALKQAIIEERLGRNVARDVPVPSALTAPAPKRRLDHQERDKLFSSVRSDRLFGLYYLMFAMGLRRGEVLGLRLTDIDFERGVLHVRQQITRVSGQGIVAKPPKGSKVRSLSMSAVTLNVLQQRFSERQEEQARVGASWLESGLLFTTNLGTALDPSWVNRHMKKVCFSEGIDHASPHSLRRTFSDVAHGLGVRDKDLQQAMGHSRIGMTMDTYVNSRPGTDSDFARVMDAALPLFMVTDN